MVLEQDNSRASQSGSEADSSRIPGEPVESEPVSCEQWKEQAGQWSSRGFFQTPRWVEILCEAFAEFENSSVILYGHDGSKVLLPLVKNRKAPGLYTWLSLPYGTYGGPIPAEGDDSLHWPLV